MSRRKKGFGKHAIQEKDNEYAKRVYKTMLIYINKNLGNTCMSDDF